MKKMKMLGIMAITALALTGCQNTSDREAALEDQVAQLEQQVTSLEKENEELSGASEGLADAATSNSSDNSSGTDQSDNNISDDNIDTLTKDVDEAVKKANNTSPSGSKDENQKNFFKVKGELQDVENRLERYEDKIEDEYRQGKLDYEKAREAEREIERLEDKLDDAEDRLENVFGYDD